VLLEKSLEHELALRERLVDRLARDLRVRLDDEERGKPLHQDEQHHEEEDDARPQPRETRGRSGRARRRRQYFNRSSGGLYFAFAGATSSTKLPRGREGGGVVPDRVATGRADRRGCRERAPGGQARAR